MATLFELTAKQREIEDALYESGGELTPDIENALAETSQSLPAKVDGYYTLMRGFAHMAENCASEIERLTRLKKVAENGQKSLKRHVLDAMKMFSFDKLKGTFCSMSIGRSKSLEIDEDVLLCDARKKAAELSASLPDYIVVEVKVSKKAIMDAYKSSGVLPSGATIVESEHLTVR